MVTLHEEFRMLWVPLLSCFLAFFLKTLLHFSCISCPPPPNIPACVSLHCARSYIQSITMYLGVKANQCCDAPPCVSMKLGKNSTVSSHSSSYVTMLTCWGNFMLWITSKLLLFVKRIKKDELYYTWRRNVLNGKSLRISLINRDIKAGA